MKAPDENIENLLRVDRVVYPTPETKSRSYIQDYESEYRRSIADPEAFWDKVARELDWFTPWQRVLDWKYPWAKWFVGATCNISYNCLDRHVKTWRRNKVAVIWVGEQGQERILTYGELFRQVNRCANALKALGLRKGDRASIYLPKIPEQIVAMLACARIGVIHSVVYSGFSAPALESRIRDAESRVVITADVGYDRGKSINLKGVVDQAVANCSSVETVASSRPPMTARPLPRRSIGITGWREKNRSARRNRWTPKRRCTSCIRRGRRANPKGWCTCTAGIWSARTLPPSTSSI